jgi:transcriptional regulator with XRE-family HTH domain
MMPQLPDIQVHPQFRLRLRELRTAAGLSLRALGARCNYSHSYLWELETGAKQPIASTAARLDDALAADGRLATLVTARPPLPTRLSADSDTVPPDADDGLQFAPNWRTGVDLATGLWRWSVQRRELLGRLTFTAAAFLAPAMRWLVSPLDERPIGHGDRLVGAPDVDLIRQVTATFRTLDNHYGGGHTYGRLVRFLDTEVAPLIHDGRYDAATGATLFSATAEMTQLAGWAAYDLGLHGVAQRYLIQALRLAVTAADRPLGAEILAAMSHQAAYLNAPAEAIDLARASGRAASDAGVAAISAEAAVLEAHGHAVGGDEAACATALGRAERTLDRADRRGDPQWIGYFDEAYLAAKFGHCFAALGRGDLAGRFAARSLEMDDRYVRGRAFNLALLATAHAQAGDLEQAASVGAEAVRGAEGLQSARAVDYIARLADRLAPHAGLPAVQEFAALAAPVLAGVTGGGPLDPAAQPAAR